MMNPLLDFDFLEKLDNHRNRITYVRITSLTLDSYPIERIEGVATEGSITIDGDSVVRRICNLTMSTKNLNINRVYWGITTQVKIEIGLDNNVIGWYNVGQAKVNYRDQYGDIIWFPMGIFLLTEFKTSAQVNNYTITLSGKDKMCLLNGDISGEFNAETDLGVEEVWNFETKEFDKIKRSIYYIIREMVHHYAKENYGNIIINNVTQGVEILTNSTGKNIYIIEDINDETVVELIQQGTNSTKAYYYEDNPNELVVFSNIEDNEQFVFKYSIDEDNTTLVDNGSLYWTKIYRIEEGKTHTYYVRRIFDGEDLGYRLRQLEYPDDLIAAPGDTVTSILDKIVKTFPNYEYFYDAYGRFIFQEKQTYVNTKWNNLVQEDRENYVSPSQVKEKVKYSFEGSKIVSSYQNTPKIGDIKNDYTVWGKRKLLSNTEIPIHMRYAIDEKPQIYISFLAEDFSNDNTTIIKKRKMYVTKDYYDKYIKEYDNLIYNDSFKTKKIPPDFLLNATYYDAEYTQQYRQTHNLNNIPVIEYTQEELNKLWWTVLDWGAYYQKLTGKAPSRRLDAYGQTKYLATINFPDMTRTLENQLIFDVDRETNIPYTGAAELKGYSYKKWSPFQHKFTGCGHTLNEFMALDIENKLDSWIFNPQLPSDEIEEYDFESNFDDYDIYIVDWREIIYQMALDYYNYNHEDSYSVKLYQNNKNSRLDLDQFNNGYTGYEQYYHDIQGFWRNLYVPEELKEEYFNGYRRIIGSTHAMPKYSSFTKKNGQWQFNFLEKDIEETTTAITNTTYEFKMVKRPAGIGYYCEETNEFFLLDDLISKDKILEKILEERNKIATEIQQLNIQLNQYLSSTTFNSFAIDNEYGYIFFKDSMGKYFYQKDEQKYFTVINSLTKSIYLQTASEKYFFVKVDKQDTRTLNENINNTEEEEKVIPFIVLKRIDSDLKYLGENNEQLNQNFLNYRTEAIQIIKEKIQKLQKQQTYYDNQYNIGKQALAPYTFHYHCDKNEEDFYDEIIFSSCGFPQYINFNAKQKERYGNWSKLVLDSPSSLIFWFDFFDSTAIGLSEFSVPAIGDRPKVENNDSIRAIIYQDVPDVLIINEEDQDSIDYTELNDGYSLFILPTPEEYNGTEEETEEEKEQRLGFFRYALETGAIRTSSRSITAQEEIDNLLYNHGYCNENVTITCVPVYYLQPNTIISAEDEQRIVNGYYILNKMTIPLSYKGTMQNTATKVPERVY